MNQDVVDDIMSNENVDEVNEAIFMMGLDVTLDEKEVPYSGAIMIGWDAKASNPYFVETWGDDIQVPEGEIWVSTFVSDYYKETPEQIIGKTVTLTPSASSIFTSKSNTMIGKEFTYVISGVFDPGQDRMDALLSTKDALDVMVDLGGFENNEQYIENIGYDMLYVYIEPEFQEDFATQLDDTYGYEAMSSADIIDILGSITAGLTVALVMFGLVSGVVAGIGIINTMIMSIYEQTKEIGVIKAIGASNRQVMVIFLIQSGIMGLIGGLFGLGLIALAMFSLDGVVVKELVKAGFVIESFFNFDLTLALIITAASIVVGVLAGLYPAMRAAKLDPIRALRYE